MVNPCEPSEGFNASELRSKLVDNLNRNGIKEKLKSQLRSKLFAELSLAANIPSNLGPESNLLIVKVADSMFIDYLRVRGFDFTLSVFLPESGLDSPSHALGEKDLLRALHLDRPSSSLILFQGDPGMPSSLLLRLLESLSSINNKRTLEKEVQTKVEVDDLLHIKLRDMDRTIRSRTVQYDQSQALLLEERMYSFQREIEENNQLKLQQQVESFKRIELAKAKLEEKNFYQAELQRQKIDFEQKLMAAQSKSTEIVTEERERMANREREMDRQNLQLKQQMLDEHNSIVIKEKQLRHESDLSTRQIALERDQLKRRVDEVQDQLEKLTAFKEKYTQKMEESMSQYKIDLNKEYSTLLSSVEIEKTKLEGDRMLLDEKRASIDKALASSGKVEQEMDRLRGELSDTVGRLGEAVRTRDTLLTQVNELQLQVLTQKGSSTLEFEISSLKRQLVSTEHAAAQRQQEYESMINSLSSNRVGSEADIITAKHNEMKWKQKCHELIAKLDNEFSSSDELSRKLDRERLRNKELERELADIRILLSQSQAALKQATTGTSTVEFSQYATKGKTRTESAKEDPLYERYAKITAGLEKASKSKIPLPSQFEEFSLSSSSISPLRQASLSFREEFLTSQELELLKRGKILSEYQYHSPVLSPPKMVGGGDVRAHYPPQTPPKNTNILPENLANMNTVSAGPDLQSAPPQDSSLDLDLATTLSKDNPLATTLSKDNNNIEPTSIKDEEYHLDILAKERQEAERLRKQVEQDLNAQFLKEEQDLAKERERVAEIEKAEKARAEEFARLKRGQEEERVRQEEERRRLEEEERKRLAEIERVRQEEEVMRLEENEQKRLAEIERVRQEERATLERLQEEERKKKDDERMKKEEEMKGVDTVLENNPVLQKYLDIVKEKRQVTTNSATSGRVATAAADGSLTSSDHHLSFGAGDTDMSAPDNSGSSDRDDAMW